MEGQISMLSAAGQALVTLFDPFRMSMLFSGVIMGLILGILPGIGGLVGLALLLPFTFNMDPYAAFALLLGLASVTSTSDTIPAVLFGVPGTAASQATVLDGLPMSKKGEAGRALSAAYTASLMGGLFGALLLGLTLPLLRPVILYIGSPELLALAVFGISSVSVLSGNAPLRGLAAAGLGIMIAMIGSDPQTGTLRWTMDTLYLWEGMPLVPAVLGLFALPELCDLAIQRTAIAGESKYNVRAGMVRGMKDAFENWWLVLRCSWLGAFFGADSRHRRLGCRLAGLWPRDTFRAKARARRSAPATCAALSRRNPPTTPRRAGRLFRPLLSVFPVPPAWRSCWAHS